MDQAPNRPAQTILLGVDRQVSVLHALEARGRSESTYCAFGFDPREATEHPLLRFNEQIKEAPGFYLLGCGYRAYNPILRVFQSPDSWSPFFEGGINAYAYCGLDPVNWQDRSGHNRNKWKMPNYLVPIPDGSELGTVPMGEIRAKFAISKMPIDQLPDSIKSSFVKVEKIKSKYQKATEQKAKADRLLSQYAKDSSQISVDSGNNQVRIIVDTEENMKRLEAELEIENDHQKKWLNSLTMEGLYDVASARTAIREGHRPQFLAPSYQGLMRMYKRLAYAVDDFLN